MCINTHTYTNPTNPNNTHTYTNPINTTLPIYVNKFDFFPCKKNGQDLVLSFVLFGYLRGRVNKMNSSEGTQPFLVLFEYNQTGLPYT